MDGIRGSSRVNDDASLAVLSRNFQKSLTQSHVKVDFHFLVAMRFASAADYSVESLGNGDVQNDRCVRPQVPHRLAMQVFDDRDLQTLPVPLICNGRVGVSVADDPGPPRRARARLPSSRDHVAPRSEAEPRSWDPIGQLGCGRAVHGCSRPLASLPVHGWRDMEYSCLPGRSRDVRFGCSCPHPRRPSNEIK